MKSTTHVVKSWPIFFNEIILGNKSHELRRCDDRHFSVGDILKLQEFDPESKQYTGRELLTEITYITSQISPCAYSQESLKEGFCILSIKIIK